MPYRLRVKFADQQFLTLKADPRAFVVSGKAATLNRTYVQTATTDTWTRRSATAEAAAGGTTAAGPYLGQGWWKACLIETTGDIFIAQGAAASSQQFGTFYFRNSTGAWERTDSSSDPWYKSITSLLGYENYDTCYDKTRNCVWYSMGGPGHLNYDDGKPWRGELKFDVASSEFYTWRPESNYVPSTQEDVAHWNAALANNAATEALRAAARVLRGFDDCLEEIEGKLYNFGGYNQTHAGLSVISIATEEGTSTDPRKISYPTTNVDPKPTWAGDSFISRDNSGQHRKEKYLWTLDRNLDLYIINLNDRVWKWRRINATNKPSWTSPFNDGLWHGRVADLHEAANCIVVWVPMSALIGYGPVINETHILDLSTMRWRRGPSVANGDTMPAGNSAVLRQVFYSPQERLIRAITWTDRPNAVASQESSSRARIWDFVPEYTGRGTVSGIPLPSYTGSTLHVNYYGFPYLANASSKHTNMAYCPLDGRIYVTGGDTAFSGTEGCWSTDPNSVDGDWRLETGSGSYPSVPVPYDAQDNMGWAWDDASNRGGTGRGKFILWPGNYIPQVPNVPGTVSEWTYGWWTFDPITKVWTQYTGLWGTYNVAGPNTFGGAYNPADDTVYVVGADNGSTTTRRYHLGTQTQLSTLTWTNASSWLPTGHGLWNVFFNRGMHALHGGNIYVLGLGQVYSDSSFVPLFGRYNIAANTFTSLSTPPVPKGFIQMPRVRIAASGNKIVWPCHNEPTGDMPYGVMVYDINQDYWVRDEQIPAYGNYIGNAVMPGCLPDGSVCFSGGVFGKQQTHFWKYRPAT